jgi:phospholipid transport system substrate-binding protein
MRKAPPRPADKVRTAAVALVLSLGVFAASPAIVASPAFAEVSDPAAQVMDSFDHTLLDTMKQAKSLGVQGRFRKMEPAVRATFDLQAMMQAATFPYWAKMSAADQTALVAAFGRFSAATYAHNFDQYSGQKFVISGVDTRLPDKLVRTQLVLSSGPINLVYRMRESDGRWRIIDVFYNGAISQLAQQRSDFGASLSAGGPSALIKKLNDQADRLLHD